MIKENDIKIYLSEFNTGFSFFLKKQKLKQQTII